MNYSSYLLTFAKEIAGQVKQNNKLESIILTGSVAKKIADKYSDVELLILWKTPTSSQERKEIFSDLNKKSVYDEILEDKEWYSSFVYKSIKVDIAQIDLPIIQSFAEDVFVKYDTSINKQLLFSAILDGLVLRGDKNEQLIRSFSNYPDELVKKCIKVNSVFESWNLREVFLYRNDFIALHNLIDESTKQVIRMLFALNKQLLRNYNFKWVDYQLSFLTIRPKYFKERIEKITTVKFEDSIVELHQIIKEVYNLAIKNYPTLDLSFEKKALEHKRLALLI